MTNALITIKGYCKDCMYYKQEWYYAESGEKFLDHSCDICDVFKRQDGYCDFYEPRPR